VKQPIVTDSTALIGLERINLLTILPQLFAPVITAPAVDKEFGLSFNWLIVETPTNEALINSLSSQLHLGEVETIVLAKERGSKILLDERKARAIARGLGLSVIGLIGILILAKQQSLIAKLTPVLDQLNANNFYMTDDLRREAIRLVGE
jgi:uncharacterized protein